MKKLLILIALLCVPFATASAQEQTSTTIENGSAIETLNVVSPVRPLRIIQFGDSHTAANIFTHEYARILKARVTADGVIGARLSSLRSGARRAHFLSVLSSQKPDLVVIAFGTNEVTDPGWTVDSYARLVASVIEAGRKASPSSSFLFIAPFDRSVKTRKGWQPVARLAEMEEADRRGARLAHAAFWSSYEAQGRMGSMNKWVALRLAQPDHVHMRPVGYRRLAADFARALASNYYSQQFAYLMWPFTIRKV
jgi:lysophospholipase L1-like esterase